jgi:Zn-dependent protease with chaperone function
MGDFFARQARARKQTRLLVLLFLAAVILIIAAVDVLVLVTLGGDLHPSEQRPLLIWSSLLTAGVIGFASLIKIVGLRSGGRAVAESLGAVPVDPSTTDHRRRRLLNVVEEMAIASGTSVPAVYVLEEEEGINAFAAGYAPSDAAVAVTRGALERLNRDELQGVIAHEFSHIVNGDMRLNVRLIGLLAGILAIAAIGRMLVEGVLRGSRSNRRGGGAGVLAILTFGALLWLIGWIGLFFGRLIKAGVSRQREYLADASAVQFTRQPSGILGALLKIAGLPQQARLAHSQGEEVSHMLFGDGFGLRGLLATHPPLEARIRAIDPGFHPARIREVLKGFAAAQGPWDERPALGFSETSVLTAPDTAAADQSIPAEGITERVGRIDALALAQAQALLAQIPLPVREAVRQPERAALLLAALIVRRSDRQARPRLDALLAQDLGAAPEEIARIDELVGLLHPFQELPVAAIALGALGRLPQGRIHALIATLDRLILADERVDLFEYCLARLAVRELAERLDPQRTRTFGNAKLGERKTAVRTLLAVLAAHGHHSPELARRAFQAGAAIALGDEPLAYAPPDDWAAALDDALPALDDLRPEAKATLLEALTTVAAHDDRLTLAEAELLRALAAVLHLPMPPLLRPNRP